MYFLLLIDKVIGVSADQELLRADLQDGMTIVTEEEYLKRFSVESTTDNVDITPSKPSTTEVEEDNSESDIKLDPVFVLEALTDLQLQLENLEESKEVADDEETNQET
jgi:hypothetical protein